MYGLWSVRWMSLRHPTRESHEPLQINDVRLIVQESSRAGVVDAGIGLADGFVLTAYRKQGASPHQDEGTMTQASTNLG